MQKAKEQIADTSKVRGTTLKLEPWLAEFKVKGLYVMRSLGDDDNTEVYKSIAKEYGVALMRIAVNKLSLARKKFNDCFFDREVLFEVQKIKSEEDADKPSAFKERFGIE